MKTKIIVFLFVFLLVIVGFLYYLKQNKFEQQNVQQSTEAIVEEEKIFDTVINKQNTNKLAFLIGGASVSKKDTVQAIPSQEYIGTGLQIGLGTGNDGCNFIVSAVVANSPASLVNIKEGDCLLKIDEKDLLDSVLIDLEQISVLLRGENGTKVKINLFRKSENKKIEVVITRGVVNLAPSTFDYGKIVHLSDVWSSSDMINWKIATSNDYKWRSAFNEDKVKAVYFKNKIFVFGNGEYPKGNLNIKPSEIWSSSNGVDWNKILDEAPWSKSDDALQWFDVVVFQDKIFVIGTLDNPYGDSNRELLRDVYSSSDGINWNKEKRPPWYNGLIPYKAIVFKEKIWVFEPLSSKIWTSGDGSGWNLEKTNFKEEYSYFQNIVVFKNNLYIFTPNQIISSSDGLNWKTLKYPYLVSDTQPFIGSVIVLNNKLWIINQSKTFDQNGNVVNIKERDNMWSTDDGINWTKFKLPSLLNERLTYTLVGI